MPVSLNLFPLLYHAHHSLHMEDIPFWLELAARHGDPILELGCGTGRVLLALAETGYTVYGLDNDPAMLAVLRKRLDAGRPASIYILQADLTAFWLQARFALIFLPCNTFSTLASDARRSMLERAAQHLQPGGVFAASLPNPEMLAKLPAYSDPEVEETFPHPLDGEPVQVSSAWKRTGRDFNLFWHYDHLLPDGQIERLSAQTRHHLAPAQTYLDELHQVGFEAVELYGDFNGAPYTEDAPHLIMTAFRKAS